MTERTQHEVLFVTSSYPRWHGDSTTPFIHHLAQDLRALGWDVRVLAPHAPGAARDEVLEGVPVHRFRYLWPASLETVCYDGGALVKLRANRWLLLRVPFLVIAQWAAVMLRLLRRRVVLVHAHWLLPQGLTAGLAAATFGRRRLVTVHGSDIFALEGAIARACKRLAIRLAQAVTANSRATVAAVASLAPSARAIERIPMGASGDRAGECAAVTAGRPHPEGGPVLVFVGRLVPEKGVSDLLRAVHELREVHPAVVARVIGDGPARAALEEEARQLGIADRVRFLGWLRQHEVQLQLRAADVFVGPSRPGEDGTLEAQGLAFAEAMLAGLPVIATAIGGIPRAAAPPLRDRRCGTPPRRRPRAGRTSGGSRALARARGVHARSQR
jgi:phosphatidyl-myo-inositol dimannoside synthase